MPPKKAAGASKPAVSKATKPTTSSTKTAPKATKATTKTTATTSTSKSKLAEQDSSDELSSASESSAPRPMARAKGAAAAANKPTTKKAAPAAKASTAASKKRKSSDSSEEDEKPEEKTKTATKTAATKATTTTKAATNKAAATKATTKAATTKAATTKAAATKASATSAASKKRKSPATSDEDEPTEKKTKTSATKAHTTKATATKAKAPPKPRKPAASRPAVVKPKVIINDAPTDRLNVYVCGEGSSGELGLGNAKNAIDVKRPRLNPNLAPGIVGVVQVAVGGMHVAALTHDSKVYTWGVNDQGALGRDTSYEGNMMDIDDGGETESTSDSEADSGLNPREATPTAVPDDAFPPGTKFVELAAGDSNTFALTDDGFVYGWGTFRSNEGILGFDMKRGVQRTPVLVEGLKKIKHLVCGENHVLALDHKGSVFSWGSGQQNQLGRRIIERTRMNALKPREFGLPKGVTQVGCGAYHSFAVGKDGKVYSWGLNNYGETGIAEETQRQVEQDEETVIWKPQVIEALVGKEVTCISGGAHHSIAVTKTGECHVWGRIDGFQTGMKVDSLPEEHVIKDEKGKPRILTTPTPLPGINAAYATAGSDHCVAITTEGKAYSWGFSANYQTGQGDDEDIEVAKMIDNTAVRDEKLIWAGAGGQFSVLTSVASTS